MRVYRVTLPPLRGQRHPFPADRTRPLVGHCAVDAGGVVAASDQEGWEGLRWGPFRDRMVNQGATVEEVERGAQDTKDGGADPFLSGSRTPFETSKGRSG